MIKPLLKYQILSITVYAVVLFSCENNLDSISKIVATDESPTEITYGLKTIMTDSGRPNMMIEAAYAEKFGGKEPKTEFSEGIKLTFFDSNGEPESVLTANYGEVIEKEGQMKVKDDVIFNNFAQKQILKTEELFWDREKRKIYTNKMVTIESEKGTFHGNSLEADESFSDYEMKQFNGDLLYSDTLK